jgi:hypothetical protein
VPVDAHLQRDDGAFRRGPFMTGTTRSSADLDPRRRRIFGARLAARHPGNGSCDRRILPTPRIAGRSMTRNSISSKR